MRPREAVRAAMSQTTPIVLTAGLVVSCGVATLMLGTLGFFRSFGPGLAITVLAGLAVSLTLVPAVLALGGRVLFWPGLGETDRPPSDPTRGWRFRLAHLATARPAALVLAALAVAALVVPASGLVRTRLGIALVSSLPSDDPVRRAEAAAAQGFAAGIVAPTELLVRDARVGRRREALVRLQNLLAREDGVAAVLGPKQVPGNRRVGVVYAPRGGAARYAIVLSRPPTDARSIESLRRLQQRLPELLAQARLDGAQVEWGGETALGVEAVDSVRSSLWRIALAVLAVNFVFLAVFLRALAAPLYLLAASALAVAATFGLTTVVFQDVLGYDGLTYYIPLAAGVLLVSLGSDYNIFVVGRIWQEAGRRPVREAVAVAAPAAGRVITIAGLPSRAASPCWRSCRSTSSASSRSRWRSASSSTRSWCEPCSCRRSCRCFAVDVSTGPSIGHDVVRKSDEGRLERGNRVDDRRGDGPAANARPELLEREPDGGAADHHDWQPGGLNLVEGPGCGPVPLSLGKRVRTDHAAARGSASGGERRDRTPPPGADPGRHVARTCRSRFRTRFPATPPG
jgi:hypothetical protein